MSDRQGIVSFPVIGVPVPDPTFGPENFLRWIDQGQPHWIYHLRVSRPPRHVRRRFPLLSVRELDLLAARAFRVHHTQPADSEPGSPLFGRQEVRQIKACVILPLKAGEQVVGVLGLHHNAARPWDTRRLKVVEAFADRAAGLVEEFLAIEARVQQILLPEGPGGQEQALERAVDRAVGRCLSAGSDGPLAAREAALLDGVFRGLLDGVGARLGWAGLLDEGAAAFLWQGTAGVGGDRALSLPPAAVLRELGGQPFVLSDPGDGRPLTALLDVLPEAERQGATDCQCLAVPMAGAGRTVAVFFMVLGPGERVEPERAQRAADTLRRAGNLVVLGRLAVPTTQAACGLAPDSAC